MGWLLWLWLKEWLKFWKDNQESQTARNNKSLVNGVAGLFTDNDNQGIGNTDCVRFLKDPENGDPSTDGDSSIAVREADIKERMMVDSADANKDDIKDKYKEYGTERLTT